LIAGAGESIGSSVAKRFAREGYAVAVARRKQTLLFPLVSDILERGGSEAVCVPFKCDARIEDEVQDMFKTIEQDIGLIDTCVFNVGARHKR